MEVNFLALLVASLSTLLIGFVWYHPKVFGTAWMRETNLTKEQLMKTNMMVIFPLTIFYAYLIAIIVQTVVIHQFGAFGMIGGLEESAKPSYQAFMSDYGTAYRTFKHGAFHGLFLGLMFAFPIIATNALFDRKSFRYVLITAGFWLVCLTLMGGIICAWE